MRELKRASEEGLNVGDYLVAPIAGRVVKRDPSTTAELEALRSHLAVARYAHASGVGQITLPSEVDNAHAYATRPFAA